MKAKHIDHTLRPWDRTCPACIADLREEVERRAKATALLPCPFCGNKAYVFPGSQGALGRGPVYFVACLTEGCVTCSFVGQMEDEAATIELWNRRP